jgi:hypothetical protein
MWVDSKQEATLDTVWVKTTAMYSKPIMTF